MFQRTTAINKLLKLTKRKKVIQGGTSAGKTFGILPILIDYATKHPRHIITICAESIPAVRNGAVRIFADVMMETGRWRQDGWRSNPMEYRFANGALIQFTAFDSVGKAKAAGKRDVLFLNEANHIEFEIADALMVRSNEIWIDYNPDNEFWVHSETLKEPDSEFLLLTYKDNEAIPPEILSELMIKIEKAKTSEYWSNWCRVYIDGEIGTLQGAIFQNWKLGEFDNSLPSVYGLDFGFSNDPDSMVKVAIDKKRKLIYLKEIFYKKGNSTSQLIELIDLSVKNKRDLIIADSADPRTINDIRAKGFNIIPAVKGPDSIRNGIKGMQDYEMIVDENSTNLIKELRNYVWHDKKAQMPIDDFNHQIDPARYVFQYLCPANTLAIGGMKR
jgi:phage terminase large subunit